jgi:PAS domain S-box-containing protein
MNPTGGRMRRDDPPPASDVAFLAGGGEMGARMREIDWSRTSLGPAAEWPQSLKTAVRIMLTSRQAMFVWWGEELVNLYNDAYKAIVGGKHPAALGQPAARVWREIWDQVGPRAESALRDDEGTYDEALLLIMERHGYPEETYYTFSYSPVPGDHGGTGGIICANTDDTQRIVGERQLALLRELAAATADARTRADACARSARCLATNPRDLPFAMIYLVEPDRRHVRLAGTAGIDRSEPLVPERVALDAPAVWPFAEVLAIQRTCLVPTPELPDLRLPTGAWHRPPHQAAAVPIASSGHAGSAGVLIVGLSPFRLFDDAYRGFLDLVSGQIAASIANAQAYEEERERVEALAELDRAKTVFFSNVSHEFRTPLTLMLGPLDDLLARPASELPPGHRDLLALVRRNGQRLLKLVNTLLDFSRIEAGRMQAVYEPVDLPAYTTELASMFASAVERAGLALVIDCPPLPEPAYVDRDMWEKIVLNLVSNAFKYTLAGEIRVSLRAERGAAVLDVSDTGTGIPEAEQPLVFQRFHRVAGARGRTHEGTGIGLALVRELVELHGGAVGVQSAPGRGSTFTVTVPLGSAHLPPGRIRGARTLASTALGASAFVEEALRWLPDTGAASDAPGAASDAPGAASDAPGAASDALAGAASATPGAASDAPGAASATPAGATPEAVAGAAPETVTGAIMTRAVTGAAPAPDHAAGHAPRPQIVLADDNADMREYVRRLLAPFYDVAVVADGAEALAAVARDLPDLVLTDVMMPNLDGFGLLAALRADPRTASIPILMLSARAGEEARVDGLAAGADDYLIKPFSARELLARVASMLALARARREAHAALRESEERFRHMADSAPVMVWVTEPDGRCSFLSKSWYEFTGQTPETGLGLGWVDAVHPDDRDAARDTFVAANARQAAFRLEYRLRHRDGTYRWAIDAAAPRFAPDGAYLGYIGSVFDITERRQAEEALREADRRKDEFLATLAHELRNPLAPIRSGLELMKLAGTDRQATDRARAIMERQLHQMVRLVDDLLDVSRISRGAIELRKEHVELAAVVQSAVETTRPLLEQQGHQLTVGVPPGQIVVDADPTRLAQVFANLLNNAARYTRKGGRIALTVTTEGADVVVRVADSGIGIAADMLPRVFDMFTQLARSHEPSRGGLGIGLSIVKRLTEMHGGTVEAHSPGLGLGSEFVVRLPAVRITAPAQPPGHERERASASRRVLVADDNEDAAYSLASLLEVLGHEVRTAADGLEAIEAASAFRPDMILLDIGMPRLDGHEACRRIRAQPWGRDIVIVALTGWGQTEDKRLSHEAGFDHHLVKPVELALLQKLLASLPAPAR